MWAEKSHLMLRIEQDEKMKLFNLPVYQCPPYFVVPTEQDIFVQTPLHAILTKLDGSDNASIGPYLPTSLILIPEPDLPKIVCQQLQTAYNDLLQDKRMQPGFLASGYANRWRTINLPNNSPQSPQPYPVLNIRSDVTINWADKPMRGIFCLQHLYSDNSIHQALLAKLITNTNIHLEREGIQPLPQRLIIS